MATQATISVEASPTAAPRPSLKRRSRWVEGIAETLVKVVSLVSIAAVVLILIFVGKEALPVLTSAVVHREVTPGALFVPHDDAAYMWQPVSETPKYNIVPLFVGTLKVTFVALLLAVPLSVGAAIYVCEFAPRKLREYIKPAIELLAGVPSVVIGFFALVVMATWVQRVFGTEHRLNALVAGMGLAFAICPVIFSVLEDALRAVPDTYRQAALALGSTRSQTLLRVMLPAAMPGIAAAVVLGFGRAIGETMIVVIASGNAALLDPSLGHSARTITATIAQELGEVVVGSPHYDVLFFLGALLFLSTLAVNLNGERIVFNMRRRPRGAARERGRGHQRHGRRGRTPAAPAARADRSRGGVNLGDGIAHRPDDAGDPHHPRHAADRRRRRHRGRLGRHQLGVHLRSSAQWHDRRRHLPRHLRHGRAHAAHDRRRRPRRGRDGRVPDGVRAGELPGRAGHPRVHRQPGRCTLHRLRPLRSRLLHRHGGPLRFDRRRCVRRPASTYGKPALVWAALTLAILTLPVVVVSTEEALRAVPRELRDGSLALGATKGQTIARVVLPQALGGILTGAILAVSRGAGEVAPIMFTGAAYFLPYLPTHLNDQFMNLGYHVYVLATQSPDVDRTKPLLYGTVLVLLVLTFLLNLVAIANPHPISPAHDGRAAEDVAQTSAASGCRSEKRYPTPRTVWMKRPAVPSLSRRRLTWVSTVRDDTPGSSSHTSLSSVDRVCTRSRRITSIRSSLNSSAGVIGTSSTPRDLHPVAASSIDGKQLRDLDDDGLLRFPAAQDRDSCAQHGKFSRTLKGFTR